MIDLFIFRQFDVEEECKDKRVEGEAGEVQSGITVKSEKENSGRNSRENSSSKASEVVQKTDYIHVRARRGQATDSHSLAERVSRSVFYQFARGFNVLGITI